MFKMMAIFFIGTVLFFMFKEIMNIRKKSSASKELEDVQTEEDLFEIERDIVLRERKLKHEKEALYSKDENQSEV